MLLEPANTTAMMPSHAPSQRTIDPVVSVPR